MAKLLYSDLNEVYESWGQDANNDDENNATKSSMKPVFAGEQKDKREPRIKIPMANPGHEPTMYESFDDKKDDKETMSAPSCNNFMTHY